MYPKITALVEASQRGGSSAMRQLLDHPAWFRRAPDEPTYFIEIRRLSGGLLVVHSEGVTKPIALGFSSRGPSDFCRFNLGRGISADRAVLDGLMKVQPLPPGASPPDSGIEVVIIVPPGVDIKLSTVHVHYFVIGDLGGNIEITDGYFAERLQFDETTH